MIQTMGIFDKLYDENISFRFCRNNHENINVHLNSELSKIFTFPFPYLSGDGLLSQLDVKLDGVALLGHYIQ